MTEDRPDDLRTVLASCVDGRGGDVVAGCYGVYPDPRRGTAMLVRWLSPPGPGRSGLMVPVAYPLGSDDLQLAVDLGWSILHPMKIDP